MSLIGNLIGIQATLLIGPSPVALPMGADALQAVEELEVHLSDTAPSGFRLVLRAGRTGPLDFVENAIVADPRFVPGARFIVAVTVEATPTVIMDGIVVERHVFPGEEASQGRIVLLGRDLSVELDRVDRAVEHPAMDETTIATLIAATYAQFGMAPMVIPPSVIDPPLPVERTPQQRGSDWAFLNAMAERYGYETYVDPGPLPGMNLLYWGPRIRPGGMPQRAMTVGSGPASDAFNVSITHGDGELATVESQVLDRQTGSSMPVMAMMPSLPPMGALPESVTRMGQTRTVRTETSGLTFAQAMARAQGIVDESARRVVQVRGTLDATRYDGALKARDQIALTGVGATFDGRYKVAEVRHRLRPGGYQQDFVLTRSELLAAEPLAPR